MHPQAGRPTLSVAEDKKAEGKRIGKRIRATAVSDSLDCTDALACSTETLYKADENRYIKPIIKGRCRGSVL